MRKKVTLITGVSGEVGLALVKILSELGYNNLLTLDIRPLPPEYSSYSSHIQGDILDKSLLNRLVSEFDIETIFHMAALLSTRAEFTPVAAHQVNVEGTMGLLQLAAEQSEWRGDPVMFIFPSSIAAYGIPDLETKSKFPQVREWEWNYPITMYGCNKLYCEMLGSYFSEYYRQLAAERPQMLDFRCIRFPGLISAFTVPSGGTSDFGPEMHTQIPFMAMPDAVTALLGLSRAPKEALSRTVYNVTSYSLTAEQFRQQVIKAFPDAEISFNPDLKRQQIVDSWPADLNDNDARRDWDWKPDFDVDRSFSEYLVPNILKRYQG